MRRRFTVVSVAVSILGAWGVPVDAQSGTFAFDRSIVELDGPWRFQLGDDPRWVHPGFDDSAWETVNLRHPAGQIDWTTGIASTPGWTAKGHPEAGFAWYRLRVHIDRPPAAPVKLVMPPVVEDGYEVYLDGRLLGSFGDLSTYPPRVYLGPKTIIFDLPRGMADLTLAVRCWMSEYSATRHPAAGGLHGPPELILASAEDSVRREATDVSIRLNLVTALQAAAFFVLGLLAFWIYKQNRFEPLALALGVASMLETTLFLVVIAGNVSYLLDMEAVLRLNFLLQPLRPPGTYSGYIGLNWSVSGGFGLPSWC